MSFRTFPFEHARPDEPSQAGRADEQAELRHRGVLAVADVPAEPDQAAEVAQYADGVIVGSALVRCLLDADDPADGRRRLASLAGALAEAVHAVTPVDDAAATA